MSITRWSEEPVSKQDLIITLGVIVAILWVGDKASVMKTIDGVKKNLAGFLGMEPPKVEEIK